MLVAIAVVIFLAVLFLTFALMPGESEDAIQARLRAMARDPNTIDLTDLELSRPFSERVLKPLTEQLYMMVKRITPQDAIQRMQKRLTAAGLPYNPVTIVTAQYLLGYGLPVLFFLIGIFDKQGVARGAGIVSMAGTIGYSLPNMWVKSKGDARKAAITRTMPDALDLLTISVEAGLGFDMALQKVVEKLRGPLPHEFSRALYEMRLGKPRREALKDMAERTQNPDLIQFTSALVQADKLGVSIGNVLRVQSDQMRLKRRQRAEQQAQKAPLKMSFVLVFFVLPA
ncbi:MAG TPA: type II secretion system F family protein, partial [bacterium]|nr:type II secretion system F family protein [bacterium]